MSRLTITLTAAAASALVAAATVALPAIGDDSGGPTALAACLRSHGLEGAPSAPEDLKPWIARRQAEDPQAVKAAMNACQAFQTPRKRELAGPDVQKLVACMRANGLDAPSDPAALKRWLAQEQASDPDAIARVVPTCKMQLDPAVAKTAKPGVCGDDAAKPDEPATKPDADAEPTT